MSASATTTYRVLLADHPGHDSACEIPYLFAAAGCTVDVYCPKRSWLLKNSYWNAWIESDEEAEAYAEKLEGLARSGAYDRIVLVDDVVIRIMNKFLVDQDLFTKILPLTKSENRSMLGSKAGLSILCEKFGIATPPYMVYDDDLDFDLLAEKVSFPLLLKIDESAGGGGVFHCKDPAEVKRSLLLLKPEEKRRLIFQKYIEGDNIALEVFYEKGELLAYTYSTVVKTLTHEFDVSVDRIYSEHPEIEPQLAAFGRAFGINGCATMTCMYDAKERRHYFIEADLRPQLWFRLGTFAGVDFSKAIRASFSGKRILMRPNILGKDNAILVRHFSRDIIRCGRRKDVKGILAWCFNTDGRWRYIPWYDRKALAYTRTYLSHLYARGIYKAIARMF